MRRYKSAPPVLLLEDCCTKINSLSRLVESWGTKTASRPRCNSLPILHHENPSDSVVQAVLDTILTIVVEKGKVEMGKQGQCHHCHRPLSHPDHVGIASGVKQCTLDHYELCPGGREDATGWTGCPAMVSGSESDTHQTEPESGKGAVKIMGLDPLSIDKSIQNIAKNAEEIILDGGNTTDDEEDRILASEVEHLRIQVQQEEDKQKQEKKLRKRQNRERLEKEKAELLLRSKLQKKSAPLAGNVATSTSRVEATPTLQEKAAELAANQQQLAAERRSKKQAERDQLSIAQIRSLPGLPSEVERLLASLQASVPSLAKTPTAPTVGRGRRTFQPTGVLANPPVGVEEYDTEFVFHAGRNKFVPVVGSPNCQPSGPVQHHTQEDGYETSPDKYCTVKPPPGYRLMWRRDEFGEKYFTQERIPTSEVETVQVYVCDEGSGRWYRQTVPKASLDKPDNSSLKPGNNFTTAVPVYADHRHQVVSPIPVVKQGIKTPVLLAGQTQAGRLPGIVPLETEKQGKDTKLPDRMQWARSCPVDWTSRVSPSNINVVLWAWAFVAELLATRTGMAPNLEQGELESKLQHFLNVLEITLQSSSQSDFGGDAWAVARLYDRKVQHKVDSRMFSWVQLGELNHGASMPHELIAATQELSRKPKPPKKPEGGEGRGKDGSKSKPTRKCPTWNTSETRGKCNWEVENAPEKCMNLHECSYCKSKSYSPRNHQRTFCRKKLAEEEG